MSEQVQTRVENGIAILRINRPPRNVLSLALCRDLLEELIKAEQDATVSGVVIAGQGVGFSTGMDLIDFASGGHAPSVARLGQHMDQAQKPIVAALHGPVIGAGLELALCAHARVANSKTMIGMPDVALGLIPGGGATQRLPRVLGAQTSLEFLLSRRPVEATHQRFDALFDQIVPSDQEGVAIALAQSLAETGIWTRLRDHERGLSDPAVFQSSISDLRVKITNSDSPENDIVDCVEAAQLLPFDQGLEFEAVRFRERTNTPHAQLLRHAFVADARARSLPPALASNALKVEKVVVLGRSADVADLAAMVLWLGHKVWIESGTPNMAKALADLTLKRLDRPEFKHPPGQAKPADRLTVGAKGTEIEEADMIFDTGELTPDPPADLKEGAVWIVTSGSISAAERGQEVSAERRTLRMRKLLKTAHLVELSAPAATSNTTVATTHRALSAAGQNVVMTADVPGGLVGSLFSVLSRCALVMLAAGQKPGDVEAAAQKLGLRQGPLQMMDVLTPARSLHMMRQVFEHREAPLAPLRLLSDRIADATADNETVGDHLLVFHIHAGQSFSRDPELQGWVDEWREEYPERARTWPQMPLERAMLCALVNEGARLNRKRVVQRLSDIDLAAEKGLFMDRSKGGPLIQADLQGLLGLARSMKALEPLDPTLWAPDPLVVDMVKNGKRFF